MVTSQIIDPLKGKAILIGVQNRGERRDEPLSPFPSFLEFFRIYLRADPSFRKEDYAYSHRRECLIY
jgi:hypothetical protein